MIVLHDSPNIELSHIHTIAEIQEGFALFDYVAIEQNSKKWIGQLVQPNRNISTVGDRLDPTILHGLKLMQSYKDVQSVESVQVFDILILGEYDGTQMLTPRIRPLPGAVVTKLDVQTTANVIGMPIKEESEDKSTNVIGELLNAEQVPLCMNEAKFNYHIMVSGGTGSGKSNAAANLIHQALRFGKCVLVHDAKPDYSFVDKANTDKLVSSVWERFKKYNLQPQRASKVTRIGFYRKCDPSQVDSVVGFNASDFNPEMLASLFFVGVTEQLQFEAFANAASTLYEKMMQDIQKKPYSLDDILALVEARIKPSVDAREQINEAVGKAILRKVKYRQKTMPWLDSVGQPVKDTHPVVVKSGGRLQSSQLDGASRKVVETFSLESYIQKGNLVVIDYSQMDEQSYALILSYFLKVCHKHRQSRKGVGIVQLVDEAHRIFDNDSRHNAPLSRSFERVMREGRSVDHSIILSLQNASQIPPRVMNNLNTKIVMRQNSKHEADAATQTMGKEFSEQSMRLGTGHALVSLHEARAVVLSQMAPSPYELMRNDNTKSAEEAAAKEVTEDSDYDF